MISIDDFSLQLAESWQFLFHVERDFGGIDPDESNPLSKLYFRV